MKIDLSLSEACFIRGAVFDRLEYLKRRYNHLMRSVNRGYDVVDYEKRFACITNELHDLQCVYSELSRLISAYVLSGKLFDEFEASSDSDMIDCNDKI